MGPVLGQNLSEHCERARSLGAGAVRPRDSRARGRYPQRRTRVGRYEFAEQHDGRARSMKTTAIYGLFDPRNPALIMYVGKGLDNRAQFHWKRFLRNGIAVSMRLRRWFEVMKTDRVEPTWRFLEKDVLFWQDREKYWISFWREKNSVLCNVVEGGNSWPINAASIGGKNNSRENKSRAGRASAQWAKDHPEEAFRNRSKAGIIGGRKNAERLGFLENLAGIGGRRSADIYRGTPAIKERARKAGNRSHELHPELVSKNGKITCHIRWHTRRNRVSSDCELCQQEKINVA